MVLACARDGDVVAAVEWLEGMQAAGITATAATYRHVIKAHALYPPAPFLCAVGEKAGFVCLVATMPGHA